MALPSDYWRNPQMHNVFRTKACQRLLLGGECAWGSQCQFSHGVHWARRPHRGHQYSPEICPHVRVSYGPGRGEIHIQNTCPNGPKCTMAHSKEEVLYHPHLLKTCLCEEHANRSGASSRGRRKRHCHRHYCPFAHGAKELRTSPLPPELRKQYLLDALQVFPSNWCCKVCEPQQVTMLNNGRPRGSAATQPIREMSFIVSGGPPDGQQPDEEAGSRRATATVGEPWAPAPPAPFGSAVGANPDAAAAFSIAYTAALAAFSAAAASNNGRGPLAPRHAAGLLPPPIPPMPQAWPSVPPPSMQQLTAAHLMRLSAFAIPEGKEEEDGNDTDTTPTTGVESPPDLLELPLPPQQGTLLGSPYAGLANIAPDLSALLRTEPMHPLLPQGEGFPSSALEAHANAVLARAELCRPPPGLGDWEREEERIVAALGI
eukprot:TRINITY_DN14904_c0_g2_i1.p1 TRINITY_DN14904_c0_g2~~TRINITY_DN14904_c0_g2_i1.p1  ORF type:complete len:430 (-),score=58.97 TRINITY_DN14904_c0_g2_i1:232-1521(-)